MKKSVIVDLYKANNPYSGLGQFSLNFGKYISNAEKADLSIDFFLPKKFPRELLGNSNSIEESFLRRYIPTINSGYKLWHSLQQFPSFFPAKNTKLLLTIHDLNFLYEKEERKSLKYLKKLQQNVNQASALSTISNYTKTIIEQNLETGNKPIYVVHNGVESVQNTPAEKPQFVETSDKFFFAIGIFNKKKNFEVLLPVMKYFEDYKLVIAGNHNTAYGSEIKEKIEKETLGKQTILSGTISDSQRSWLYQNCSAFLFPSMAEGFGMPAIEAMSAGKPVFLSKYTSLPEIGGDSAFYFDNFQAENMAAQIKNSLEQYNNNKEYYSNKWKMYSNTFSWENAIKKYLEIYSKELGIRN